MLLYILKFDLLNKLFINKNHENKNISLKILLLILLNINIIVKYENIYYFRINIQIRNIKRYYKINSKGILINKFKSSKISNPKVSIISSVYNREKYILRFLRSIQNQLFEKIEIIFIDDYSNDNSVKIIEKYQIEDERIILLKNKKNKGTLISRNIGALKAKGEFLIFPDSDDLLSQNILSLCYDTAIKYNYTMIRFNMYSEKRFPFSLIDKNLSNLIYQPKLRTYLIYGFGYKKIVDGILSNKFIQRISFLITLNDINNFFLNQHMIYFEDALINFALHFKVKSLFLLKSIGYYYFFNKDSVSRAMKLNIYLKNYFIYLKYIIENTKNIEDEQNMIFYILELYINDNKIFNNITIDDFQIYHEVINLLLDNRYITSFYKKKVNDIKNIILKLKKYK